MNLSDFIEANAERIVGLAIEFALSQSPPGTNLDPEILRNDIPGILQTIVLDLRSPQTANEQREKSEGRGPVTAHESAATSHGRSRANDGFDVNRMIAEYRALRASVLRLWAEDRRLTVDSLDDMIRFNEAIDQAAAESLAEFSRTLESWRNVFLGALGHDLRGPLNAVVCTADMLLSRTRDTPYERQVERILSGAEQVGRLVDGLLDYSKSSLGGTMALHRTECDLGEALTEEVELLRATLDTASIHLHVEGELRGHFDCPRIREAMHNLVTNAAKYGDEDATIGVSVVGKDQQIVISVTNAGEPLRGDTLNTLFDPLRRGSKVAHKGEHTSLGLGLFIVREIAVAHGGEVTARSAQGKTTFLIVLPKLTNKVLYERET